MVPTLCRTLGVKGHRPVVGTWDCKDMLYVFASVNVGTSQLHTKTVACRTGLYRRTGESKTRRLQRAFAEHLRQIAVRYPAEKHPRVVLIIDNAPWHAGEVVQAALRAPAPGTQALAQLQSATQRDRAVLEVAPPARHPQPTVRHDRRPEALDPQQHLLLPDRPLEDPIPHR